MLILRAHLEVFVEFIKVVYGIHLEISPRKNGELTRFMLEGSFFRIMEHAELSKDALTVLLVSSNKDKLREVENAWNAFISPLSKNTEESNVTEPGK